MTAERPALRLTPMVWVDLSVPQPGMPARLAIDDGTIRRFLEWLTEEEIYPVRGPGGTSSGGWYRYGFTEQHAGMVLLWAIAEGLDIEDDGGIVVVGDASG